MLSSPAARRVLRAGWGSVRGVADGGVADGKVARTRRLYWLCFALSAAIGGFLVDDVVRSRAEYGAGAWLGVVLSALAILALVLLYAGCARGRVELTRPVSGKVTLFHLSAIALVVAVGADILIPGRDTGGLALLLPWGISYWLHHLTQAPSSD